MTSCTYSDSTNRSRPLGITPSPGCFASSSARYFRKGCYFGLACFANMPVESELERGARMKSVGILCPSYTLLYRYMHFLENQVRSDVSLVCLSILAPVVHPVCAQCSVFTAALYPPPVLASLVVVSSSHLLNMRVGAPVTASVADACNPRCARAERKRTGPQRRLRPLLCRSVLLLSCKPHILHTRVPQLVRFAK